MRSDSGVSGSPPPPDPGDALITDTGDALITDTGDRLLIGGA